MSRMLDALKELSQKPSPASAPMNVPEPFDPSWDATIAAPCSAAFAPEVHVAAPPENDAELSAATEPALTWKDIVIPDEIAVLVPEKGHDESTEVSPSKLCIADSIAAAQEASELPIDADVAAITRAADSPIERGVVSLPGRLVPAASAVVDSVAQPYVELRDNILSHLPVGRSLTVAVASVEPLVDRATTIGELAKAFVAKLDGNVLLLSADLGSDRVIDQFGVSAGPGIQAFLKGTHAMSDVIVSSGYDRLDLLAPGEDADDEVAGQGLASETLLARCKQRYDLVIVDLGPAGRAHVGPLARRCDSVYFVVRLGETLPADAVDAVDRLQVGGVRLHGCILSGVPVA